ncbi:hypothetical protein ACFC0C_16710 [Streptomyces sp. NPDC056178]|uniref:hypothetical protein n=2 Tax=Streptomyces TaxID=1883 RepID=UPI0035E3AB04
MASATALTIGVLAAPVAQASTSNTAASAAPQAIQDGGCGTWIGVACFWLYKHGVGTLGEVADNNSYAKLHNSSAASGSINAVPSLGMCASGLKPYMRSFPRWSWLGRWNTSNDRNGPRTCGFTQSRWIEYVCWSDANGSTIQVVGGEEAGGRRNYIRPICDGHTHGIKAYQGLRRPYHLHWHHDRKVKWNQVGLGLY